MLTQLYIFTLTNRPQMSKTGTAHVQDMHSVIVILGYIVQIHVYQYGY